VGDRCNLKQSDARGAQIATEFADVLSSAHGSERGCVTLVNARRLRSYGNKHWIRIVDRETAGAGSCEHYLSIEWPFRTLPEDPPVLPFEIATDVAQN
jgi:hypothetical protein